MAPEADLSAPLGADGRPLTEQEALKQKLEAKVLECIVDVLCLNERVRVVCVCVYLSL